MYYVYVLKSDKDGNLYVGYASDLKDRFINHNAGKVLSTKSRIPLKLVFQEAFVSKKDALLVEKFYKTGYSIEILKGKIKSSLELL